jgi:hypothetical protein
VPLVYTPAEKQNYAFNSSSYLIEKLDKKVCQIITAHMYACVLLHLPIKYLW